MKKNNMKIWIRTARITRIKNITFRVNLAQLYVPYLLANLLRPCAPQVGYQPEHLALKTQEVKPPAMNAWKSG